MTVRRLTPEDALLWREVRLRMLSADPENYGVSCADWADRPVAVWEHALRRTPHVASMAKGRAVGAMRLWPRPGRSAGHRGTLIALWVEPESRGRGRAEAMLNAIAAIAKERGPADRAQGQRCQCTRHPVLRSPRIRPVRRAAARPGVYADDLLMVKMLDA